jgi:hypothetical protein
MKLAADSSALAKKIRAFQDSCVWLKMPARSFAKRDDRSMMVSIAVSIEQW